ncbi:hypothetical protein [Streptomyces fulvorobeus]|uniref:Uncharacterized protein n=1 Tax=Streptomyces fulvorobeus TaxID=284028 RepID=A0A7Y9H724_9ACTN|nr:hypothetical protein [Streptomyces fulvorobeus]NYE39095.1 hypothetical protein [Streptomyces fulvorobeus]
MAGQQRDLPLHGLHALAPVHCLRPRLATEQGRKGYLDAYAEHLCTIETTDPLFMHPREDYGPDQRLLPSVEARSGFQWNPRAGQTRAEAAAGHTPAPQDLTHHNPAQDR